MSGRLYVRERWRAEVYRTHLVGEACRVLLLLLAEHMDDRGYVRVPREQLARTLDVKPQRVTDRISEATRAGFLVRLGGGHNARTAQYAANFPPRLVPAGPIPTRTPLTGVGIGSLGTYSTARTDTYSATATARPIKLVPAGPIPVRARGHARALQNPRARLAPDGSRAFRPQSLRNSSSNGERATPVLLVAADPSVRTTRPQPALALAAAA